MNRQRTILSQLLLGLFLLLPALAIVYNTSQIARAKTLEANHSVSSLNHTATAAEINSATTTPTSCRYGVASWSDNDYNFLQDLGVGWTLNFNPNFGLNPPDGVEYSPMIRFKPETRTSGYLLNNTPPLTDAPDGLGTVIANNPGRLWQIGNEVDRVFWQDDLMPDVYAEAYHDLYHFIKDRDPSAQIAISGLVQVTPGRIQYLDIVWDTYLEKYGTPMPVDVWNMHIYILPEIKENGEWVGAAVALGTDESIAIRESGLDPNKCPLDNVYCYAEHDDMGIFADQVVAMRQWMKDHGQQNKPLILSEFSLLYPNDLTDEFGNDFTPARIKQFMLNSFNYLETATSTSLGYPVDNYRLVQQWLWFAVSGPEDPNGSYKLLQPGYSLTNYTPTLIGQTFVDEMNGKRPFSTNAIIGQVSYPTATTITPTGTISATIAATVYNNGDTAMTTPITVTFYADAAKTNPIGTSVIPAGLGGCTRHTGTAQVTWDNLSAGLHHYWAEIEGGNTVAGFVIINPEQVYLPTVMR